MYLLTIRTLFAMILLTALHSSVSANSSSPVIYLVGDSTMANKSNPDRNPERGWGQLLPEYVDAGVEVRNHASGGRSSKSFIDEMRWQKVVDQLQPGDWVVIQFGHNDQKKKKPNLYTDPASDYRDLLKRYIEEARACGAKPVLATSIYRRYFKDGKPRSSLGDYPEAARAVASELDVPLVDLHFLSGQILETYGEEGSKALFLHFEIGENEYFPDGKRDNSHLSEVGARLIAEAFATDIAKQEIGFPVASVVSARSN